MKARFELIPGPRPGAPHVFVFKLAPIKCIHTVHNSQDTCSRIERVLTAQLNVMPKGGSGQWNQEKKFLQMVDEG